MKNTALNTFFQLLEDIAHAFAHTVRQGLRTLNRMSWPSLMLACVGLALILTVVPLALFLFVVFMGIKIIVASIVIGSRRDRE